MSRIAVLSLAATALFAQAPGTKAPEPAKRPWTNLTTLSFVGSSGNSKGQAFSFADTFTYKWDELLFTASLGATRASNTVTERKALSNQLPFVVYSEKDITTVTAEQYFGNGRLDWKFAPDWYWYGGGGWERNRPAGTENRTSAATGLGRIWIDTDDTKFKTDLGLGYTWDKPVYVPVGYEDTYGTGVLSAAFKQKLGPATLFNADLIVTSDLSNSTNWTGTGRFGLAVSMSKMLALKAGVDVNYRNVPNQIQVPVYSFNPPVIQVGKISVDAKKTDVQYSTSLVITF